MFDGLPSEELLESTHSFPCVYRFKVIGNNNDHFVGRVIAAVREELAQDAEPSFSTRTTTNGRHISVTIEPELETAATVIAIYARLRELDGLVMLM